MARLQVAGADVFRGGAAEVAVMKRVGEPHDVACHNGVETRTGRNRATRRRRNDRRHFTVNPFR
jgi:hypothetical protein